MSKKSSKTQPLATSYQMVERNPQASKKHCITTVTPTICKLMGIDPPAKSEPQCLLQVIQAAKDEGIENVEKCLVFAPDAVGMQLFQNHRSLFDNVLKHAPIKAPMVAVFPPKTPVCYASMFTGALPQVHGIEQYEKHVLTCDTIFDALLRSKKKPAIVSVNEASVDLIFRKRDMNYFSEPNDVDVTRKAIEIIKSDNYDLIVAYQCEYDDVLHKRTPYCPEAIQALSNHIAAFAQLAKTIDIFWQRNNRAILFAPDHGAHIDPKSGKGVHENNIPEDMHVQHYFGIKGGA